jgi:putative transposase
MQIPRTRPRFGCQLITVRLRRDGGLVTRWRVRRLYRLQRLQLWMRVRRCERRCLHRDPVPLAARMHERWRDFAHDAAHDGRSSWMLTVVDQYRRQSPLVEVAFAHSDRGMSRARDRVTSTLGLPTSIRFDHGTEFTSTTLEEPAWQRGIKLDFIRAGKPSKNTHMSFNGRLRNQCLNVNQVVSTEDARHKIEAWRQD